MHLRTTYRIVKQRERERERGRMRRKQRVTDVKYLTKEHRSKIATQTSETKRNAA